MKSKKAGKKHPLLLYQRFMDRLFWPILLVGVAMFALWWVGSSKSFLIFPVDILVLSAGIMCLLMAGFLFLARRVTYVQAHPDHLRLITPFLRLKISYRRVRSVHSANVQQLFPPEKASGAEKSLLEPFYSKTVIVVDLAGYPVSPGLLRLFFPKQAFVPKGTGFVLITSDWMALSTDIDTALGNWRQSQNKRNAPARYKTY